METQMTDTPEDWVLHEAMKRCGWTELYALDTLQCYYVNNPLYRALCDMIAKHEQKPVDRKLLCAREAYEQVVRHPSAKWEEVGLRAIELFEGGYGK
jgi:hypothetical protein